MPHARPLAGRCRRRPRTGRLWAEVLAADAYAAFTETGDSFDPDVAARLRRFVFSAGNTMDPAEAYRLFRGRDPSVAALMRWRGFPVTGEREGT